LWIDRGADCVLSGGSSSLSPFFVPKVNSIVLEYDQLLSSSFGVLAFIIHFCSFFSFMFVSLFLFHFHFIYNLSLVNINGKLLLPCGLRVEARVGSKDNEKYEILEIEEWSTEERAVVAWPIAFESQKDVDWFIRVLYGQDMKQVC
jgi:hypothetical protein